MRSFPRPRDAYSCSHPNPNNGREETYGSETSLGFGQENDEDQIKYLRPVTNELELGVQESEGLQRGLR